MKILSITCILLTTCLQPLLSQITFQKTFGVGGEIIRSGIETTDSGFAFIGTTTSYGAGNSDIFLIKTNKMGDLEWTKTFGDSADEVGYSLIQSSDRGFVIAGQSTSYGAGNTHALIIKTDSVGNLIWANIYSANRDCNFNCIKATSDSGYILTGSSITFGSLNENVYLLKIDSAGNQQWSKSFGVSVDSDIGTYVEQTMDGGYVLTGIFQESSVLLIKTNDIGDTLWTKVFTGGSINISNYIHQTSDKGYIISGIASFSAVDENGFILKTDSLGNVLWANLYGTTEDEYFFSATASIDNGIMAVGSTNYYGNIDVYLVKVDSTGDTLWTNSYGNPSLQLAQTIVQTHDYGFLIGGSSDSAAYLVKGNLSGETFCDQRAVPTIITAISVVTHTFSIPTPSIVTMQSNIQPIIGSGGMTNTICIDLGYSEPQTGPIASLAPNPTNGKSYLCVPKFDDQETSATVISLTGKSLFTTKINTLYTLMDLKKYGEGYYFIKLENKNSVELMPLIVIN